jgi:hypothetical protein
MEIAWRLIPLRLCSLFRLNSKVRLSNYKEYRDG